MEDGCLREVSDDADESGEHRIAHAGDAEQHATRLPR
jgi:hypothetical protein